jgi:hypothetical protein
MHPRAMSGSRMHAPGAVRYRVENRGMSDHIHTLRGDAIARVEIHEREVRVFLHTPDHNVLRVAPDGSGGLDTSDITSVVKAGH